MAGTQVATLQTIAALVATEQSPQLRVAEPSLPTRMARLRRLVAELSANITSGAVTPSAGKPPGRIEALGLRQRASLSSDSVALPAGQRRSSAIS